MNVKWGIDFIVAVIKKWTDPYRIIPKKYLWT